MRTAGRVVMGVAVTGMVSVLGFGGYNIYDAFAGDTEPVAQEKPRTGRPTAQEVREAAAGFLAAWQEGRLEEAGALTDFAPAAEAALQAYEDDAHAAEVTLKPGTPSGTRVPFEVTARISVEGGTYDWSYDSALRVVRGETTGKALVDWQPAVLHPELREGETLSAGQAPTPAVRVTGHDGTELDAEELPSLKDVLPKLREQYGAKAGGTAGVEVWAVKEDGSAGATLHTLAKGTPGTVRTTLDARLQRAAEDAVLKYPESSVVAVEPSTGGVLAFANHRDDGFNAAFSGQLAPGSTMKIVTAAMLLEKGLVAADRPVECSTSESWGGQRFQNLGGFDIQGGTFAESFARSCNTAFIGLVDDTEETDLKDQAEQVFGLGRDNWKTGIPSFDGRVPEATGPNQAAAMIGQGEIQMNPLNVASITATAKAGVFRQPVLVSPELDGRTIARADRAMPAGVSAQLRAMMRRTAVSGTGAQAMAGLGGDVGAKTGSAEVGDQGQPDSWFAAYRDDVAAAAVVQAGGHGGDAAGPLVRAVLAAGG